MHNCNISMVSLHQCNHIGVGYQGVVPLFTFYQGAIGWCCEWPTTNCCCIVMDA